jgi:hypothetical protein
MKKITSDTSCVDFGKTTISRNNFIKCHIVHGPISYIRLFNRQIIISNMNGLALLEKWFRKWKCNLAFCLNDFRHPDHDESEPIRSKKHSKIKIGDFSCTCVEILISISNWRYEKYQSCISRFILKMLFRKREFSIEKKKSTKTGP